VRWSRVFCHLVAPLLLVGACSDDAAPAAAKGPERLFEKDIVPLLSTNCALAACHSSKESPQSFFITYDSAQMYAELMKPSPTCKSWKFVVPGKPEESLIMVKMDGEQTTLPKDCASARRSEMPPGDPPGSDSELLELAKRDILRAWIKAGAKNN
jgi:hypothetical protein